MQGSWELHKPDLTIVCNGNIAISKAKLYALHYAEQIKICYDPATPETVIKALFYSPDQSVVKASQQRPHVLSGKLRNPFLL